MLFRPLWFYTFILNLWKIANWPNDRLDSGLCTWHKDFPCNVCTHPSFSALLTPKTYPWSICAVEGIHWASVPASVHSQSFLFDMEYTVYWRSLSFRFRYFLLFWSIAAWYTEVHLLWILPAPSLNAHKGFPCDRCNCSCSSRIQFYYGKSAHIWSLFPSHELLYYSF